MVELEHLVRQMVRWSDKRPAHVAAIRQELPASSRVWLGKEVPIPQASLTDSSWSYPTRKRLLLRSDALKIALLQTSSCAS